VTKLQGCLYFNNTVKHVSTRTYKPSKLEIEKCSMEKNIFFLKSSKTGSTTMMSIFQVCPLVTLVLIWSILIKYFQRIGLHYDMNFLMGENHGGMAVNNRPFNLGIWNKK